jgi:hypothetical protein
MMESNVVSLEMAKKLREMQSYYVFSDGRVYSTTTRMFLKPYINGGKPNQRYLVVRLQEDRLKKTCRVHRLVAEAYLPNPHNLPKVNHEDGNKLNPQVGTLEWVRSGDNRRHAYATGLDSKAGERNGNAKHTIADIKED